MISPKDWAIGGAGIVLAAVVIALTLYISSLKFEIQTLTTDKASLTQELSLANTNIATLESNTTVLKGTLQQASARADELAALQEAQKQKGIQQEAQAKQIKDTYKSQIDKLTNKVPVGATECEKVLFVLQDF